MQQKSVDTIDGPLLVVAGPGTGKTELLSMRVANILRKTDTLPENILCLTFTESGARAMHTRLESIIGAPAHKVAIHTFHGFGASIMNDNNSYFYHGSDYKIADELTSFEILNSIFDELDYSNPLASKLNGEYVHANEAARVISELKRSGLTSDELLEIIDANETVLDATERSLASVFADKISIRMIEALTEIAKNMASVITPELPSTIPQLANIMALSLARSVDEASETGKTTPITAWRNQWLEKNIAGDFVYKDRKRNSKLRAMASIYYMYINRMAEAGLYDYDDMILNIVHALETQPDLKFNLQEKYQYILVDEFQDTNLAQLRILFNLTDNPVNEGRPNIMAVGDDDQAIYSFQGADINNIKRFQSEYPQAQLIVLKDNYRSAPKILEASREVITQSDDRLEDIIDGIDKKLTPHHKKTFSVTATKHNSTIAERAHIAEQIHQLIESGEKPEDIAVLTRRHSELINLLPYISAKNIKVNYERQDNVLENSVIKLVEKISRVIIWLGESRFNDADSLLPEILAHPSFSYEPESIWRLSLKASRDHITWVESMMVSSEFSSMARWLVELASKAKIEPFEVILDDIIGTPSEDETREFVSPIYGYFFSPTSQENNPEQYIELLESLRTMRDSFREYRPNELPTLATFIGFIDINRRRGTSIKRIVHALDLQAGAINIMTTHKSKGLEFEHVFIHGATDNMWGEKARSRSRLISYPANLQVAAAGDNIDERLRLFFVAMTRTKSHLHINYSETDDSGRATLPASFLSSVSLSVGEPKKPTLSEITSELEIDWHGRLTNNISQSMKELLAPKLENYKLSATHLNNFIDIVSGGPTEFLTSNLLRFPRAKSPSAAYGTAIHSTLQRVHAHATQFGHIKPLEDILADFTKELASEKLDELNHKAYLKKGTDTLTVYLREKAETFNSNQKTELGFGGQNVFIGEAHLTGSLDLVDVGKNEIFVTDYKTGKPSRDWKGKTEFEKIKLHKYRQQLMFYELLARNSRDYSSLDFLGAKLQFVEPDVDGSILSLDAKFTEEELAKFSKLIQSVWKCIIQLDFPDISGYSPNIKGIQEFEQFLIDKIE